MHVRKIWIFRDYADTPISESSVLHIYHQMLLYTIEEDIRPFLTELKQKMKKVMWLVSNLSYEKGNARAY